MQSRVTMSLLCPNCQCNAEYPYLNQLLSADLPKRVRNNSPPLTDARQEFESGIFQAQEDLRKMDAELDRLRISIIRLKNQRRELQQQINMGRSLLSPIRRFPLDILREVFLYFCTAVEVGGGVVAPATILGGVCSHWRSLTYSTREAWSMLKVNLDKIIERDNPILQEVLSRSGSTPLTLVVEQTITPLSSPASDTLQLLVGQCHRWFSFRAKIPQQTWYLPAFERVQDNIPILEHLSVNNFFYKASKGPPIDIFSNALQLRKAELDNFPHLFQFPLGQLSFLNASYVRLGKCIRKDIYRCTRLENLSISLNSWMVLANDAGQDEVVELSELATFVLKSLAESAKDNDPLILATLFSITRAPHLKTVKIVSPRLSTPEWPQRQFLSFLSPSSSTITRLCLKGTPMAVAEVLEVLNLFPSLRILSIDDVESGTSRKIITNEFVARMTLFSEHSFYSLVKSLHTLKIVTEGHKLNQKEFIDMIHSRCLSTALRCLEVNLTQVSFDKTLVSTLGSLHVAAMRIVARDRTGVVLVC